MRVLPLARNAKHGAGSVPDNVVTAQRLPLPAVIDAAIRDPFISTTHRAKRSAGLCRWGPYTKGWLIAS